MYTRKKSRVINMSVPVALLKEVDRLAKREERTRSEIFREAARRYVEQHRWGNKDSSGLLLRLAASAVQGPRHNPDHDEVLYGKGRAK